MAYVESLAAAGLSERLQSLGNTKPADANAFAAELAAWLGDQIATLQVNTTVTAQSAAPVPVQTVPATGTGATVAPVVVAGAGTGGVS